MLDPYQEFQIWERTLTSYDSPALDTTLDQQYVEIDLDKSKQVHDSPNGEGDHDR